MTPPRALLPGATVLIAVSLPAAPVVEVCHGFGCRESVLVELEPAEWRRVRALLEPPPEDGAGERQRLRVAIGLLEAYAGRHTGTGGDAGRNYSGQAADFQLDCIDESTNTTRYLRLLERQGLLRHHRVAEPELRIRWLFFQHWTAVIEDLADGGRYAVDSWYGDNGAPADVLPIDAWRRRDRRGQPPLELDPRRLACPQSG